MTPGEIVPGIPDALLAAVAALLVLLPALLAYLVDRRTGPRAALRARLAAVAGTSSPNSDRGRPPADRARLIRSKLRETGHEDGGRATRHVRLRLRAERAGLTASLRTICLVSGLSAAVGTLAYLALGYPPLFAPAAAAVMGVGLPRTILNRMARRRQKRFTQLFADAIDIIVRGIRSGLPVGECLAIVARESPAPVGPEFGLVVEGQRLGLTLKQALDRACRRMPTADMRFFAVVLGIQQQTGGNLAETLSGLSSVLRGRKKLADKIRVMSSEARLTATIIGTLPFLISLAIYALNPAYITLLWTDPLGNLILYGGLLWMAIGVLIMRQMVSLEA